MPARVKKNMPCNKPRKSPNPKKKKVVKACADGKEKIIHYGAAGYGHNINKAGIIFLSFLSIVVCYYFSLVLGHKLPILLEL